MSLLAPELATLAGVQALGISGCVSELRGMTLLVGDLPLPVGSLVSVRRGGAGGANGSGRATMGEIVGFTREHAIVMLLGKTDGIRPGDRVVGEQVAQIVGVGRSMLGRVLNGLGEPIDGLGPVHGLSPRALDPAPIGPLDRRPIDHAIHTGVRAIDLMTTLGGGQRIGIFAGPGVGKSTLLGMIARGTSARVNVIALVGERGREVQDFIRHSLGPEGLGRSVVVAATGDESPLLRIRAAKVASAIAEYFRDEGADVLLMLDSVTRFAHAQRQVGLSVGEPPATRGYTPSVFAQLATLLERAGAVGDGKERRAGSVTGIYTILVEGDDMTEPVADAARGILDGHIILSRRLAQRAHFPAIDVLDSVSRLADDVTDEAHVAARRQLVRMLASYRDVEDLVQIGAYAHGSSAEADVAIEHQRAINELLRQGTGERAPFQGARDAMVKLAVQCGDAMQRRLQGRAGSAAGTGGAGPAQPGRRS